MAESEHIFPQISEIRKRIAAGDLCRAIKDTIALCEGIDGELYNAAINRSGEFQDVTYRELSGIIELDYYFLKMNQIRSAILKILDRLEKG